MKKFLVWNQQYPRKGFGKSEDYEANLLRFTGTLTASTVDHAMQQARERRLAIAPIVQEVE